MASSYMITNGKIVTPEGILTGGTVIVENGIITDVMDHITGHDSYLQIDAQGAYIAPGFCDMHIHGCASWGFDAVNADEFAQAQEFLAEKGVLTFLPTLQCDEQALRSLASILDGHHDRDAVPGIYLEGPFVSTSKRGGIESCRVHPADTDHLKQVLDWGRGHIRMMTIAPELPGIKPIVDILLDAGVIPALGHTKASFDQGRELMHYIEQHSPRTPVTVTHLFNASSAISHKEPGLSLLPFLEPCYYELNADGTHVHDRMLQFVHRHGRRDRLVLISDALLSAGLGQPAGDSYAYYGERVYRNPEGAGVYRTAGDTLVGSSSLLTESIMHYRQVTGADVCDIMRAASTNPYALLRLSHKLGALAPGYRAGIVLLDDDMRVLKSLPL